MAVKTKKLLRKLPLLEQTCSIFSSVNLENTLIICVQHLASTTYTMFQFLFKLGLKPTNLFVLGKCYSTDPEVYKRLLKEGVYISPASIQFNSHSSFDEEFDKSIDHFLSHILSIKDLSRYEKIIILDDGGDLLTKVNYVLPKYLPIVSIEQTSSGYNRLRCKAFNFPIINLARSWLKLEYESSLILEIVQNKLREKINNIKITPQKVLIMGGGALGSRIFNLLEKKFQVSIFDLDPEKSHIMKNELDTELPHFDLIIGCTGSISLPREKHKFLKKGVFLASISSTDREFDAPYLRKQIKQTDNCHKDLKIKEKYLFNCGFPINFDQDYRKIDPSDFQLTRSLTLASICEAYLLSISCTKGFISLSDQIQLKIKSFLSKEKHNNLKEILKKQQNKLLTSLLNPKKTAPISQKK